MIPRKFKKQNRFYFLSLRLRERINTQDTF